MLPLLGLNACGGGGGDESAEMPPAAVRSLAYVLTDCEGDLLQGATMRQSLRIRQDDQEITVVEHSAEGGVEMTIICAGIGTNRQAPSCARRGVFHRLGVSPDGSQVVFEVTDEHPLTIFPQNTLPTDQKGIFAVRADGNEVRRLGPPSRDPPYVGFYQSHPFFAFSPDGSKVAYTDRSSDNPDAVQISTLDTTTGVIQQLTHLPPAGVYDAILGRIDDTCCPVFTDNQSVTFLTYADVNGENPQHHKISVSVKTDGTGDLTVGPLAVAIRGSQLVTIFHITGSDVGAALLTRPGTPLNPPPLTVPPIEELFAVSGDDILQLTNFRRWETGAPTLSADGQRVFFPASPPSATNPTEDCQIWSIDPVGGDLRQLTHLHEGERSTAGCALTLAPPNGCFVHFLGRDVQTDDLVFFSTCNPLRTNPYGTQVFAVHQDGTGLRQLTHARGYSRDDASGSVSVELPYPFANPGNNAPSS